MFASSIPESLTTPHSRAANTFQMSKGTDNLGADGLMNGTILYGTVLGLYILTYVPRYLQPELIFDNITSSPEKASGGNCRHGSALSAQRTFNPLKTLTCHRIVSYI